MTPATKPGLAKRIDATPEFLVMALHNRRVCIPWSRCSPKLAAATFADRQLAKLSPGGYGIHWPNIDEDLAVETLVDQFEKPA